MRVARTLLAVSAVVAVVVALSSGAESRVTADARADRVPLRPGP
jgi:hypothetical protein